LKNETLTCPQCGDRRLSKNLQTGLFRCYCGHSGREPGSTGALDDVVLAVGSSPPVSLRPLSERARRYLVRRLPELSLDDLPAPIEQTDRGLLFRFADSEYWQERRWPEYQPPKWRCPDASALASEPYRCLRGLSPSRIVLCEGVFDALAVWSTGDSALGCLTTVPRVSQLRSLLRLGIIWLPDGDVRPVTLAKGAAVLRAAFDDVTIRQCPRGKDPADLAQEGELRAFLEAV
jgi:hypothetical protein